MGRILILDTSTEQGFVAIYEGENLIEERFLPIGLRNSRYLLPELEAMGIDPKGIDCIGVGIGPGSYTGIRVGVVVGKVLSYAWKVPLVGVCSLRAYVGKKEGPFSVLFDARISGAYRQRGVLGTSVEWVGEPEAVALEDLGEGYFVTPHTKLKEKIKECEIVLPTTSLFAKETLRLFKSGKIGEVEILYLRKTQAELD